MNLLFKVSSCLECCMKSIEFPIAFPFFLCPHSSMSQKLAASLLSHIIYHIPLPHSYTLLVGKPPFETSCLKDTYTRIKMNEYHIPSTRVSASARCLIKRLLQPSPTSRPNMTQILEHDFLTSGQSFVPSSSLVIFPVK